MLAFCGIVAGGLLFWTPLPGNLSSGNIPKGLLHYMPIAHTNCIGHLSVDCQSVHRGHEAEDPGSKSSPCSELLIGTGFVKTNGLF